MCKRSVNVESFLSDSTLLVDWCRSNGAHVMHAIRQLDDEHSHVLGHRHQHFSHGGCLLCFARIKLQALKFGQAINNSCNLCSEARLHVCQRDFRVFNRVMEQCGYERNFIESNFSNDSGNSDWVADVQLTTHSRLMAVCSACHFIRCVNQRNTPLWVTSLVRR